MTCAVWELMIVFLMEPEPKREDQDVTQSELEQDGELTRVLGQLATCCRGMQRGLQATLRYRRELTDDLHHVFIMQRFDSPRAHPNIILRGRVWHSYSTHSRQAQALHMHDTFSILENDQRTRLIRAGRQIQVKQGHRQARCFVESLLKVIHLLTDFEDAIASILEYV